MVFLTGIASSSIGFKMARTKVDFGRTGKLAIQLLVALVLLLSPYAQIAATGGAGGDAFAPDHHVTLTQDDHNDHGHALERSSGQENSHHGSSSDMAAQCCDMFCVGFAFCVPSYGLPSRPVVQVRHVIADADVAPGEWVLPLRPPNA